MADASVNSAKPQTSWKAKQAYAMATICLLVGLLAGYLLRGSSTSTPAPVPEAAQPAAMAPAGAPSAAPTGAHPMPTMEQMKQMADTMAKPLLEKLKTNPNDAKLLVQLGALYNKTHQFKDAATYYDKALKVDPKNVEVRNDLASCLYYAGDADGALAQLQQSLKTDPKNVDALFNLGMIRWKGKNDAAGAVTAWQQLLKDNPSLDRKPIVEKMIAEAKTQGNPAN